MKPLGTWAWAYAEDKPDITFWAEALAVEPTVDPDVKALRIVADVDGIQHGMTIMVTPDIALTIIKALLKAFRPHPNDLPELPEWYVTERGE